MHSGVKRCWGEVVGVTKGGRGRGVKFSPVHLAGMNCTTITQLHKSHNLFQLSIMESRVATGGAVSICRESGGGGRVAGGVAERQIAQRCSARHETT